MSQKIRSAAFVLVLSALFVSSAYALPPVHTASPRPEAFLAAAWSWFASLVLPVAPGRTPELMAIWGKEGSSMDPNGKTDNFSPNGSTELSLLRENNGKK